MSDTPLLAIAGLFGLGLLHGLGPDHLAALGTFASKGRGLSKVAAVGVRFGAGHAALLAAGAAICLPLGLVIPETFERAAELMGGSLVALLGLAALLEAIGVRFHRHRLPHGKSEDAPLHLHVGRDHAHEPGERSLRGAALVGALLAFSGLRGLLLLLPAASSGEPSYIALAVTAFGVGVMASMVGAALFGFAAARLGGKLGLLPGERLARGLVGTASLVVGSAWIVLAF